MASPLFTLTPVSAAPTLLLLVTLVLSVWFARFLLPALEKFKHLCVTSVPNKAYKNLSPLKSLN